MEKLGEGVPPGTVFRSRVPDGIWSPGAAVDDDLVLTATRQQELLNDIASKKTFLEALGAADGMLDRIRSGADIPAFFVEP